MTRYIGLAVVAIGLAAGCEQPAPEPPAPAKEAPVAKNPPLPAADVKDLPPTLAEVVKERNKLHQRQTGALLTVAARWEKQTQGRPAVMIEWIIDYNGPRHPFTVLTPTLMYPAAGQTAIHFWCVDDDRAVSFKLVAEAHAGTWVMRPEDFSVATDGKPVAGRLAVHQGVQLGRTAGRWFGPDNTLYLQLEHAPRDRGDWPGWQQTLDAWTGQLWSQVVPVAAE